jgi:uncharacterized protein YyaL (SSP411 family)
MSHHSEFSNHLVHETSPYLKQHVHNPVDWYPWGPEALALARRLDRPIFLSIGYSACHWCHVMAHESFEDPDIGRLLNEHFVSIKVDREERPDLDQIYMNAVMMLTGQGGWPMSMFLTPDLKPFYGGTYFPPDGRYGRPSFKQVLQALIQAWQTRQDEITQAAADLTQHLQQAGRLEAAGGGLEPGLIQATANLLSRAFDATFGGFGRAPKFPHSMELRVLLRAWKRFGDDNALHMVRVTLDRMAMGGLYDHLGGGFHRYSTDERWLVPHFEKMLYDNALLTMAYLEAHQATGEPFYREVVEETLGYALREMTSPEGPFYSTQDADSEGEEGKFFVWSAPEIERVLGANLADVFMDAYGVTVDGNWEGHNILNRTKTYDQQARLLHLSVPELQRLLDEGKRKLLAVRSQRVWPGRDEKVLTSWNGLMINALAQAAPVLDQPAYAEAAARAADFLLTRMRGPGGRLWRTYSAGSSPKLNAYLEDYSFVIDALVSLYEATFAPRWLTAALDLTGVMIEQFWDEAQGGFFYTGKDHETLIARSKDPHDSSIPSGNSMAVTALLRLARLTGRTGFQDKAETTLRLFRGLMADSPTAAGQLLTALDFYLGPVQEFAVVGEARAAETKRVFQAIHGGFRPNKVVAWKAPTEGGEEIDKLVPLLADKKAAGGVTTYICQNSTCQAPLVGPEAIEEALTTHSR